MWVGPSSQRQGVGPHTCSDTGATKAGMPLAENVGATGSATWGRRNNRMAKEGS